MMLPGPCDTLWQTPYHNLLKTVYGITLTVVFSVSIAFLIYAVFHDKK